MYKRQALKDQTDLKEIKNVKGDETYTENGNSLTWNTEGQDIYYQGKTGKDLPVSVNFTYYLDGKKMTPKELSLIHIWFNPAVYFIKKRRSVI